MGARELCVYSSSSPDRDDLVMNASSSPPDALRRTDQYRPVSSNRRRPSETLGEPQIVQGRALENRDTIFRVLKSAYCLGLSRDCAFDVQLVTTIVEFFLIHSFLTACCPRFDRSLQTGRWSGKLRVRDAIATAEGDSADYSRVPLV
jgi:hypothetical protein